MKSEYNYKRIMMLAWEIARSGFRKYGGNVKMYFATALALAWQKEKALPAIAESKTVLHVGLGQRFVLPGVQAPSGNIRKGQRVLPGIIWK